MPRDDLWFFSDHERRNRGQLSSYTLTIFAFQSVAGPPGTLLCTREESNENSTLLMTPSVIHHWKAEDQRISMMQLSRSRNDIRKKSVLCLPWCYCNFCLCATGMGLMDISHIQARFDRKAHSVHHPMCTANKLWDGSHWNRDMCLTQHSLVSFGAYLPQKRKQEKTWLDYPFPAPGSSKLIHSKLRQLPAPRPFKLSPTVCKLHYLAIYTPRVSHGSVSSPEGPANPKLFHKVNIWRDDLRMRSSNQAQALYKFFFILVYPCYLPWSITKGGTLHPAFLLPDHCQVLQVQPLMASHC